MLRRHVAAMAFLTFSLSSSSLCAAAESQSFSQTEHAAWVARVLEQMLTIKPGMTRSHCSRSLRPKEESPRVFNEDS